MFIIEIYCYMHSQIEFLRTIMASPQNAPLIIGDMQETLTFRRQQDIPVLQILMKGNW